jgi:hypothetical protein
MAQIILDSNNNLIQGDFDNATLNNRTKLQTTTTNATTNVYIAPNGSSTSAGVSVANNSSLTNASKIVMATNGSTDTQIISGINGSGSYLPLSFYTNNALAGQFTTAGLLSLPGGGITFPATQVPSADANTLDDYEEGTWTPAFSSAAGTVTYGQQKGVYTKIGDTVFVSGFLQSNSTSGATGSQVFITGLPFTPTTINGQNGYSVLMSRKNGWSSAPVGGMTLSGQTQFEIYDLATNNNTADSIGTDIASAAATSLWFSLYYEV